MAAMLLHVVWKRHAGPPCPQRTLRTASQRPVTHWCKHSRSSSAFFLDAFVWAADSHPPGAHGVQSLPLRSSLFPAPCNSPPSHCEMPTYFAAGWQGQERKEGRCRPPTVSPQSPPERGACCWGRGVEGRLPPSLVMATGSLRVLSCLICLGLSFSTSAWQRRFSELPQRRLCKPTFGVMIPSLVCPRTSSASTCTDQWVGQSQPWRVCGGTGPCSPGSYRGTRKFQLFDLTAQRPPERADSNRITSNGKGVSGPQSPGK